MAFIVFHFFDDLGIKLLLNCLVLKDVLYYVQL